MKRAPHRAERARVTRIADYIEETIDDLVAGFARDSRHTVAVSAADPTVLLRRVAANLRDVPSPADDHDGCSDAEGLIGHVAVCQALRAYLMNHWLALHVRSTTIAEEIAALNRAFDAVQNEAVMRYLRRLEQDQDLFIAMLSHDLRNPLHAIMLSAATLQRRVATAEPERTIAARIAASGARMDRLVCDLLEFARLRLADAIPLTTTTCNLATIVRGIVDELRVVHPGRSIVLSTEGDTAGCWDAERIAQVISNLAGNALQHGDRTQSVLVDVSGHDGFVRFCVHNGGTSFPADLQHVITEAHPRALMQRAEPVNLGVRLGLYIVRAIVAAHDGTVHLTSEKRRGTLIEVVLPRNVSASTQQEDADDPAWTESRARSTSV